MRSNYQLEDSARDFRIQVPPLVDAFNYTLSYALSLQEADVEGFSFSSPYLYGVLYLYGAWWVDWPQGGQKHQPRHGFALNGLSFFVSHTLEHCSAHLNHPTSRRFTSIFPIHQKIRWAAYSLRLFLDRLNKGVNELYQIADRSAELCIGIEQNINDIQTYIEINKDPLTGELVHWDASIEQKRSPRWLRGSTNTQRRIIDRRHIQHLYLANDVNALSLLIISEGEIVASSLEIRYPEPCSIGEQDFCTK